MWRNKLKVVNNSKLYLAGQAKFTTFLFFMFDKI